MPATPARPAPADSTAFPVSGPAPPAGDRTAVTEVSLPTGARLGKYQITRVLGRGGMGCVYAAYDPGLRRTVAVKVMHPELSARREFRERFLREARAVAALAHDNVIGIFEVDETAGTVFFAMPHLSGASLAKYLATRGVPPLPAAVRIAREVASGLAAAHAVGLLHRDVKPGNVFLESPKGRAKLLDFGLVTPATGESHLTEVGLVVGTPAYMSPEQARGRPLDARADLFSLGAVLYHLCGGRMPFVGKDSLAVLAALVGDAPTPVRVLNPRVPPRLGALIDRLLCKDPAGRPAAAAEVVAELRAIERELIGGGTNAVAAAGGLTMPAAPLDAELVDLPDPPADDATEPDRRPVADAGEEPEPEPTPRPKKRRKGGRRKAGVAWWVWVCSAVAAALLLAFVLALAWPALNGAFHPPTAPSTSAQATAPTVAPPTVLKEPPAEAHGRPWWDGNQWQWYGLDGQAKPLPANWRPGQRMPPDFRLPPPPPPGPPPPG